MWRLLRKTFAFLIEGVDVMALLPSPLLLVLDLPEMAGALDTFLQPWEKAQRNLRVTSCVSLGPSRSRCLNVMKCARILLGEGKWGGSWRRLGEPSDYDQIWSQMKKGGGSSGVQRKFSKSTGESPDQSWLSEEPCVSQELVSLGSPTVPSLVGSCPWKLWLWHKHCDGL